MSWQPRSDIVASDFIGELEANTVFSSLTDAQQLQILNTVTQQISNFYVGASKSDYNADNLGTPPTLVTIITEGTDGYTGCALNVTTAGTTITFSTAFTTVSDPEGDYAYAVVATVGNIDVGCNVTKTAGSITFTPSQNGVKIVYHISPFT